MKHFFEAASLEEWKKQAKLLFANDVDPSEVHWQPTAEQDLLSLLQNTTLDIRKNVDIKIPKRFLELAKAVAQHRDPSKWHHLYSLLWKIQKEGKYVLEISSDPDVYALEKMQKNISRDIHKMHAFVRFKQVEIHGEEIYVAWYEPDHFILDLGSDFFVRRFGSMKWIIATPDGYAFWDREKKHLVKKSMQAFHLDDELEDLWKSYYGHIFNPARIKIKAMKKEMPTRFWKNLPEASIIGNLLQEAPRRVEKMNELMRKNTDLTNTEDLSHIKSLQALAAQAEQCKRCELHSCGKMVFGEGRKNPVVFVGECPGDEEEKLKKPFVGPAGRYLRNLLEELHIDTSKIYFTNAVKHFNYELRGHRRVHKTPRMPHIKACNAWLTRELELIQPQLVVCLGAIAAHSVMGYKINVTKDHGEILKSHHCDQTLITFHPSYFLRLKDGKERDDLLVAYKRDLKKIFKYI